MNAQEFKEFKEYYEKAYDVTDDTCYALLRAQEAIQNYLKQLPNVPLPIRSDCASIVSTTIYLKSRMHQYVGELYDEMMNRRLLADDKEGDDA